MSQEDGHWQTTMIRIERWSSLVRMDTHGLDWMAWCCAFLRHAFYVLKEITDDPVSIEHSLFVLVMCRRESPSHER